MASINLQGDTSGSISISAPSVAGSNTLTLPATTQTLATQNALGVRNLIINGDMRIAQRGTSFASLTSSQYCLDRFSNDIGGGGAITVAQSSTAPSGFINSMSCTVATADSSIASGDAYRFTQPIEGLNITHLNWGTANAKTVTLSFYVRSSVTGIYGIGIQNSAETENYVSEYTINSANTWEQKTITIAGPTSGTWLTTNGVGLSIRWDLGSGTNYNGTANTWQTTAGKVYRTSSCVNWIATSGATFYITGVQLEVGDTATPFEHRPYDMELARCQRYCIKYGGSSVYDFMAAGWATNNSVIEGFMNLPVEMRTQPSASASGLYWGDGVSVSGTISSITLSTIQTGNKTAYITFATGGTSLTTYRMYKILSNNSTSAYIILSAEL